MRRIGLAAGLALALAGCGVGSDYQLGSPHGGGRGLPAVRLANAESVVVPPGRGPELALALRSFVASPDGWQEAPGATCRVAGGDYLGGQVVTPVRLVLPDLGPDAPTLTAECQSGTLRGTAAVAPDFSWPADTLASPPARSWWGGGWWWGYQKSGPVRYPDLAVGMR